MKGKNLILWVQLFIIPFLILFVMQCGDDEEEALLPAPLICQAEQLREGTYEFNVTSITDLCWFALQPFASSIPGATFYLPDGESGYPYTIAPPGISLPIIDEVTGTISADNATGRLVIEIDNQPLSVALNMQELTQNFCRGTLNMVITVTEAALCPSGGNVIATFNVTIDEVPVCDSCTCAGSSQIDDILESASPGCRIIIVMFGTLQPD